MATQHLGRGGAAVLQTRVLSARLGGGESQSILGNAAGRHLGYALGSSAWAGACGCSGVFHDALGDAGRSVQRRWRRRCGGGVSGVRSGGTSDVRSGGWGSAGGGFWGGFQGGFWSGFRGGFWSGFWGGCLEADDPRRCNFIHGRRR